MSTTHIQFSEHQLRKAKRVAVQQSSGSILIRWGSRRGLAALIIFLVVAATIEFLIVLYAMNLGVTDSAVLTWSFIFPGTSTTVTLTFSPLFELIPILAIVALTAMWAYLTKQVALKTTETQRRRRVEQQVSKAKPGFFSRMDFSSIFGNRIKFARATVRGGIVIFVIFALLVLLISLLAFPGLIYQIVTNAYQTNPGLLDFFRGTGAFFASIGSVFAGLNNALLGGSVGVRDFVLGIGSIIDPLANSNDASKYLAIQNASLWATAIFVLIYGRYGRTRVVITRKR